MEIVTKFQNQNIVDYDGLFVVLEGIDGSGKTLQAELIASKLEQIGIKAFPTQEPRKDVDTGDLCRKYLSDEDSIVEVDALIFAADRIEHYYLEVLPKLQAGYVVVSDRYVLSSMVYQHFSGVDLNWIQTINQYAPPADLSFYLSVDIDNALDRVLTADRDTIEKFEKTSILQEIDSLYHKYIPEFLTKVDANRPPEEIADELVELIVAKKNS